MPLEESLVRLLVTPLLESEQRERDYFGVNKRREGAGRNKRVIE